MKITIVITSVVAIIGVLLAALFFAQTQSLTTELQELTVELNVAQQSTTVPEGKNSQFEAVCASGEKLVRIHEFGVIPGNLIDEFEAISKTCGFSWCNPRYCDYIFPSE